MKCEEVRDEMIAYLKGELDEERRKEIEEHLARCQGCQRELEIARRVLNQVQSANEESVIDMAEDLVKKAIESGASDIHVEPTRDGGEVRFRIDGVLHPVRQLPISGRDALTTRLKMMAGMPLTEKKPQTGRMEFEVKGRTYDIRMSTMPVVLGETLVMRILDRGEPTLGLERMGFSEEQLTTVRSLLHQPNGMIICTGPTGSGKTTLLYSMVLDLVKPEISVVSVEDPVEFQLPGVQQAQVNAGEGLTFASLMRSYLRQDPDVIIVGEMRDLETLEVAAHAAMTGHLLLGTMLPPDAISLPQRMIDYGVEPWIAARTLIGVIACRLARAICKDCREEYTPDPEALEFLGLQAGETKFYRGKGCPACRETGHRGRVQLHEILVVDPALARMISSGETDPEAIRKHAATQGFTSLVDDGRRRVLEGVTTAEEAYRVLSWS